MKKLLTAVFILPFLLHSQSFNVPAKKWGLSFGNSTMFTGIRFNFADHDIEKVKGISFTMWQPKGWREQTGLVSGISIGLPMAGGTENRSGFNIGVLGMSATSNLSGFNIGGLGIGSGENVSGFNFGGLGIGSGGNVSGINIAGLGVGGGDNVSGFTFAVLGVGTGNDLKGINVAGLGVGAGNDVKGINISGLGMGAGGNVTGLNIAGVGVGAGGKVTGINLAGVAVGAGEQVSGLNLALVAVGAPTVKGISIASVVGGEEVKGISIAPAYLRVGGKDSEPDEVQLKGVAISLVTDVKGENNGLCVGLVNKSKGGKGFQLGLINYNSANRKGLRLLPIFNANFSK